MLGASLPGAIDLLWEEGEVHVERIGFVPGAHASKGVRSEIAGMVSGLGEMVWGPRQQMHFLRALSSI